MGRYKERNIAHFGVDYFKAVITLENTAPLFTLSANSTFFYIDEDTMAELLPDVSDKWSRYFVIKDRRDNTSLAFIGTGGKPCGKDVKFRDFYEVTGQGLILRGGPPFYLDLAKFLGITIVSFNRIDVCLDLIGVSPAYFYNKLITEEKRMRSGKIWYREGEEETIYFGEKSRKKNNYQLVRIYDKKRDSKVKKKEYLYPEYDEYEHVTRLEVEIREEKARYWDTKKLVDINFIFAVIVKTFYGFNYQFFGFLKFDDFVKRAKFERSLYRDRMQKIFARHERQIAYGTSFTDDNERRQWRMTFISYANRLIGDGMTPREMLVLLGVSPAKAAEIDENLQFPGP